MTTSFDPPEPASPRTTSPTSALRDFLTTEAAGGVVVLLATTMALIWANSPWQASYHAVWDTELGIDLGRHALHLDLRHWVNDGLMALFFLVVALEVKRELLQGELRDPRRAALPVIAAVGGMVVPALVDLAFNPSAPGRSGWGIPMATDIAFALGVLAIVARSVPATIRLFLLTLAIVDDIGAILVIAIFYSSSIDGRWLATAGVILLLVAALRYAGFVSAPIFVACGVALWVALHASGVHATLAGVAMGFLVPATPALTREIVRSRTDDLLDVFSPAAAHETTKLARQSVSQLEWLEHHLHGWTSFAIVPVFALANGGIPLGADAIADASTSTVALGAAVGLVVGKSVGILGTALLATRLGLADMPEGTTTRHLLGVAMLGGIGFTVSIFVATLAFDDATLVDEAKVGILAASLFASVLAALLLRPRSRPRAVAGAPAP